MWCWCSRSLSRTCSCMAPCISGLPRLYRDFNWSLKTNMCQFSCHDKIIKVKEYTFSPLVFFNFWGGQFYDTSQMNETWSTEYFPTVSYKCLRLKPSMWLKRKCVNLVVMVNREDDDVVLHSLLHNVCALVLTSIWRFFLPFCVFLQLIIFPMFQ